MRMGGGNPLKAEDQAYFQKLYTDHYRALLSCARQLGIAPEAAEDDVQDAFLVALNRIGDIKACDSPRAYLQQILKNVVGSRLRSLRYALDLREKLRVRERMRQEEPPGDELPPEELYRGAVGDGDLSLLIRFYVEGWSQRELAEELGISENAVKMRLKHARGRLRSALEKEG